MFLGLQEPPHSGNQPISLSDHITAFQWGFLAIPLASLKGKGNGNISKKTAEAEGQWFPPWKSLQSPRCHITYWWLFSSRKSLSVLEVAHAPWYGSWCYHPIQSFIGECRELLSKAVNYFLSFEGLQHLNKPRFCSPRSTTFPLKWAHF